MLFKGSDFIVNARGKLFRGWDISQGQLLEVLRDGSWGGTFLLHGGKLRTDHGHRAVDVVNPVEGRHRLHIFLGGSWVLWDRSPVGEALVGDLLAEMHNPDFLVNLSSDSLLDSTQNGVQEVGIRGLEQVDIPVAVDDADTGHFVGKLTFFASVFVEVLYGFLNVPLGLKVVQFWNK